MANWFNFTSWFKRENWTPKMERAKEAVSNMWSSFNETGGFVPSGSSVPTAAIFAESQRLIDESRRKAEEQRRKIDAQKALELALALEEEERRNKQSASHGADLGNEDVPGGGFEENGLRPQPSPSSYAGSVPLPARQIWGQSGLWASRGDWKLIQNSDNVYAIRYDIENESLFIQFKHWAPPMPFGAQNGPGPIYEYKGVSIPEAHSIFASNDVGEWLWDRLRIRGTWSGHQKPYRLVSISHGYLPRKATANYKGTGEEWFVRRQTWGTDGKAIYSQLPTAPAPPMGYDGRPYRATPNRGRPNDGKPRR